MHKSVQRPKTPDVGKQVLQERDYQSILVAETRYCPGAVLSSHAHDRPSLVLVTGGEYSEVFDTEERCAPGMLRYLPANVTHANKFRAGADALVVHINSVIVERVKGLKALESNAGNLRGPAFDSLGRLLLSEYQRNDEASPLALECLVLEILIEMSRRKLSRPEVSPALLRARDLLHSGAAGPLRLAQIAHQVGMHPAQLSRDFHHVFGGTMSDYLRKVRIQRAQEMLKGKQIPLSKVGELCGFHDQSHFYRSFQKSVGMTPQEYRKLFNRRT